VGGTVNITGNVTGGTATGIGGISNGGNGAITVTGNVTGGTISSSAHGLINGTTGICTIVGICTGGPNGSSGANNASTGTVRATRAVGNAYGPANSAGLVAAVGISNVALGICEIEQFEFGTFGQIPVSGTGIRLKKANTNVAIFNYCDTAGAKTLIDATANAEMPASTDVRSGVSYASGAATGSCAVPAASSVAFGVPVDATTGTAVLTAAAIRAELATELGRIDAAVSSRLAPNGTLATVTNLTNAPASVTPSDIWSHAARTLTSASGPSATDIRQELDTNSTKLANLDATVSSRLASSAYSAAPTTSQIATAVEGSLLNEADGQAVLNAIVGAIGNTNVSEVSLVAAVRADLERVGGKIDSIPAAPTAAANASAVRTELTVELAKVAALNTDRLANVATTAIVGNLIAQANS